MSVPLRIVDPPQAPTPVAGRRGRRKTKKQAQNWGTPRWFVAGVAARLGPITVDLCAEPWNAKADTFFTKGGPDDVFTADLSKLAGVKWCNPPYAEQGAWLKLARSWGLRGETVACLPQAMPSSGWWRDYVDAPAGRLKTVRRFYWAIEDDKGRDRGGWATSYRYERLTIDVCFPRRIAFDAPPGERHGGARFASALIIYRPPDARQRSLW